MARQRKIKAPVCPFPAVKLVWLDAYSEDQGWQLFKDVKHEDKIIVTTGHLIEETQHYFVVAQHVGLNEGHWEAGDVWHIPKRMVVPDKK